MVREPSFSTRYSPPVPSGYGFAIYNVGGICLVPFNWVIEVSVFVVVSPTYGTGLVLLSSYGYGNIILMIFGTRHIDDKVIFCI